MPDYVMLTGNRNRPWYPTRTQSVRLLVLHITTGLQGWDPKTDDTAEKMARGWTIDANNVSWHAQADSNSVVYCLPDSYTAWHVAGYNSCSVGLEMVADTTNWNAKNPDWVTGIIDQAARYFSPLAAKYGIPHRFVTKAQADAGAKGFAYHGTLNPGTRTDPGLYNGKDTFPHARFLQRVAAHTGGTIPPAPVTPAPTGALTVDGLLGPASFARIRQLLKASTTENAVRWIQTELNRRGVREWDGKPLVVDGAGILDNTRGATPKTRTQYALQAAYKMPVKDGVLSSPSDFVKVWQRSLNAGKVLP